MVSRTYDTESMDIQTLKHAACLPYRLAGAILGRGTMSADVEIFELDTAGQGPPPQYAIYLLPGGRWIFYTDRGIDPKSGGLARISCTDVSGVDKSQRVSSFSLRLPTETSPTIHAVQSDPDNSRVTVVVTYQDVFPTCVFPWHYQASYPDL